MPEWEWFTRDGDAVMNALSRYEHVTVLYGHIHREDEHQTGHARHYAARSLCFAFPDPQKAPERKPVAFDPERPFRNLGLRLVSADGRSGAPLGLEDIELTMREFSGTEGFNQLARSSTL